MPVLKTYTAQIGPAPAGGGRRASAEDFGGAGFGATGKALQDFGSTILENKENDESRQALIASTEVRAKYARALDEATLSGGDLTALKTKMAEDFSKIGENFSTKRGAEMVGYYAANAEIMYDEQANRIEVQRASAKAKLDGSKFVNDASAIIRSNPGYLAVAEANVDALVATFPKLRPDQRAAVSEELKQQLNMAAALAQARIDPAQTVKDLNGGRWNLSPPDRQTATSHAETEIRARRAEQAYAHAEDERQKREQDDKSRDKHFKSIFDGTFTQRAVMDDPGLRPETREHLIVFAEQRAKALNSQEKASNQTVVRDLWLRIHAPETDPKRIYNGDAIFAAVNRGDINTNDANQLNTLVANQRDENNRAIGSMLAANLQTVGRAMSQDPKYIGRPELVAEVQMDYQARVFNKVSEYRAAGKNPHDLFDPSNKDFVGSQAFILGSVTNVTVRAQAGGQAPLKITSREDYDALVLGAIYIDSEGNWGIKTAPKPPAPPIR